MAGTKDNPIQSCTIEPSRKREERELVIKAGAVRFVYGPSVRPFIDLIDQHEQIEVMSTEPDILGTLPLVRKSNHIERFLTIRSDHVMKTWRVVEETKVRPTGIVLRGHTGRIGTVWTLPKERLMSWSEDHTVRVWSTSTGEELASFDTSIESPEGLLVDDTGESLCLMEQTGARMCSLDGSELTVLKGQTDRLDKSKRLAGGRWLTLTDNTIKLWSSDGRLKHFFTSSFSFSDGYFISDDGMLFVMDALNTLMLFDRKGARVASLSADYELAQKLRALLVSRKHAESSIKERPSFEHFEHRCNPISNLSIPKHEQEKLKISAENLAGIKRKVWNFFNRADKKHIQSWLKEDIQVAIDARTAAVEALPEHRERWNNARALRALAGGLCAVSVVSFLVASDVTIVVAALLLAVISGCTLWVQNRIVSVASKWQHVLRVVSDESDKVVETVKGHRRRILANLPSKTSPAHIDDEVRSHIQKLIWGELLDRAFHDCGVQPSDLVSEDREPIIVEDCAILQFGATRPNDSFSPQSLMSFWWTSDDEPLFAVQYIQYIFLTREKIDIFAVFYDFIKDQIIHPTAHAFYYRDVTNISTKEVERPFGTLEQEVAGTELALSLSSGERLCLTILNDKSPKALPNRKDEEDGRDALRQRLVAERPLLSADNRLQEERRRRDDEALKAQLEGLDADDETRNRKRADKLRRRAEIVIANIRSQILEHKRADTTWASARADMFE